VVKMNPELAQSALSRILAGKPSQTAHGGVALMQTLIWERQTR